MISLAAFTAVATNAEEKIAIDVYISDKISSTKILEHHKAIVSSIFDRAGVQICWHGGQAGPQSFGIRLVGNAPPSASSEALASTRLTVAEITVYYDRVRRILSRAPLGTANVALAYVFAHELAHAMEGIARHSESGILKARWSNDDFEAMILNEFAFTDTDIDLIRKGLSSRRGVRKDIVNCSCELGTGSKSCTTARLIRRPMSAWLSLPRLVRVTRNCLPLFQLPPCGLRLRLERWH
jgi:hypothetical protein